MNPMALTNIASCVVVDGGLVCVTLISKVEDESQGMESRTYTYWSSLIAENMQ